MNSTTGLSVTVLEMKSFASIACVSFVQLIPRILLNSPGRARSGAKCASRRCPVSRRQYLRPTVIRSSPAGSRRVDTSSRPAAANSARTACALFEAVLECQPPAAREPPRGATGDGPDRVEAVLAGDQRGAGLEAQVALREVRVRGRDVGRVRHDQREWRRIGPRFERVPPVAFAQFQATAGQRVGTVPTGVLARQRERARAAVGSEHLPSRAGARERHCDASRSGAQVEHPGLVRPQRERRVDQILRFGSAVSAPSGPTANSRPWNSRRPVR